MRDSTVLVVLLLTTVGAARDALNVRATEETCSNITISWTAMDNRAADITILYNSTVHSGDVDYVSPPHTTTLTNLVADSEYTITVTAKYSDNTTTSGTVTTNTSSGNTSNKAISTTFNGSTSLSFKVKDSGGSATYDCWVNSTDHRLYRWTTGSITTVSGLDPGTYYNITCQKRPKNDPKCPITHAVMATKPNPPANVTITQMTCNSVTVNWSPPTDNGNAEITHYRVHVYKDSEHNVVHTSVTTMMTHQVTSLEPDTSYTVEVTAGNVGGFGNKSSTKLSTTRKAVGHVNIIVNSTNSAHSILLSHNESGLYYKCDVTDMDSGEKRAVNKNVTTQLTTMTGLLPDTTYRVECEAYHSDGVEACLEVNTTVTTYPSKVQNVRVRGSMIQLKYAGIITIRQNITWDAPANCSIQHYVVKYQMNSSSITDMTMTKDNGTHAVLELNVTENEASRSYTVQVAAVSEAGQGEFSDRVDFSYSRPGAPTDVSVQVESCHTLKVTWLSPAHTGGLPITGYNISYTDTQNNNKLYGYSNTTMISLQQLKPGTQYIVRVRAMNAIGEGEYTQNSSRTSQRVAGNMSATANSANSILLSYTESGVYYLCNVTDMDSGDMRAVNKNVTTQPTNVTGLLPGTTYRVDCVGYRSGGVEVCLEANTAVTTFPSKVQNVRVRGSMTQFKYAGIITIRQNITWDAPANRSIQHYVVKYQMNSSSITDMTTTKDNGTHAILELNVTENEASLSYTVQVAAVSEAGQGEFSDRVGFSYSRPGVPTGVIVQAQSCHTLNVTWSSPGNTGGLPITGYNISYTDKLNNNKLHRNSSTTMISLRQLKPGTEYIVRVRAMNAIGQGDLTQKYSGKTIQRAAGNMSATANSANTIHLSYTLMESGVYYQCDVMKKRGDQKRTVTIKEAMNVTGLLPDTTYKVDCVAYHSDGVEACLEANITVTTRPDRVQNVTIRGSRVQPANSSDSITIIQTITWDAPPNHHNIQHYLIKYQMQGQPTSSETRTSSNATQTTLVLLVPRGQTSTYSVWVAAVSEAGQGEFSDRVDFNYSRPGAPAGVIVQAQSCNTLNVTWSSPHHTGGLPITGYNISYTDGVTINAQSTLFEQMALIRHCSPGTIYAVKVAAINVIGQGEETTMTTVRTKYRAKGYVNVTANSAHSILLSHNVTESGVYYVCNVKGGEKKRQANKNVTTQSTTVTRLLPDTTYRVDCVAYRSGGVEACLEANTTVTTLPAKVQNVTIRGSRVQSANSSKVNVLQTITWDAPPNHHNIQHYLIKYQMQGQPTSSETRTSSNATQASLVLLVPRGQTSTYSVWVGAVSEAGQGEFSDRVDFNYSTPDPPTGVNSANSTCNSITLTWSAPHHTGGVPLEGYAVRWSGRGSPLVTDGPDVTAVTITHLSPNTSYTIDVRAVNAIGEGQESEQIIAITVLQDKPLEVSVSTISSTSLHITAQPPPGLEMVEVNCTLTAKETSSYVRTISLDNTRDGGAQRLTDNLVPYTNYTATCLVFKDGVDQCYIGSDITQTYTDKPTAPPQEVSIVSTSSQSFTMMWAPPPKGQQNGVIVSYEVEYREEGSNSTVVNTTRGMRYTAEDLTTDRVYQFRVAANTVNGTGPFSEWENVTTIPTVTNLKAVNTTTNSTTITWDQPPHNYRVLLQGEATDNIIQSRVVNVTGQTTHIVEGLNPFQKYTISVYLESNLGQGSSATVTFQTLGREPTAPPQEVSIVSTSSHSFTMAWAPPPKGQQNGELVSYEVEYREEGSSSTMVNTTTRGMRYTAEDLTTDRVYQFRVAANTVNGTGPFSEWENVTTIPIVINLMAINTTTNSITITWDQPPYDYTVFLQGEATDNIPQSRFIQLVDVTEQTTHIVEGLNSFRNYSISVFLAADNGNGSDATVTFQTLGQAPDGSPTHLTATPTNRSVTLQWSPPPVLSRNGILTHYVVVLANETWNTTQSHSITGEQRKRRDSDSEGVAEETQSLTVEHLRPFTNYTWEVAAVSDFGAGPPSDRRRFETEQDVPSQVEDITVNPDEKTITWAAPVEPNGIIVGYLVQYWELGRRDTTEEVNTTADKLVFLYNIFSAGVPHKVQVQAATIAGHGKSRVVKEVLFSEEEAPAVPVSNITITRINDTAVMVAWAALTLNDARGFPSYVVSVTSKGKEAVIHLTNSTSVVVEGLMPHTEYSVTVQALTAGGTKEGPPSAPVTIKAVPTEEPTVYTSPLIWILAVLIAVLLVVAITFIVIVAVICIRWRYLAKLKGSDYWETIPMTDRRVMDEGTPALTAKTPEDKIQRKEAILRRNFCVYVQKMHQDKNGPFLTEYQNITHTPDYVSATVYQSNMIKNRYINVFPYDHSRVVLKERDSTGSDYINAAYIDAYNRANGYIASQGPTSYTLDDFWQMVWEHHAPVIVMLTKLAENNKLKCERYWETALNEPFKPGRDLSVTTLRCETHSEFELRTIKVEKLTSTEDPLVVKHFLYTAWPDHGVPQYSVSIHRFIRQHVRPAYDDSSAPLIVHCSAGAGRTGTYMAIDTMMYQLEDTQNANIFEYVEKMRTRRTQMVQNVSQYIYIHDAINDYINCKETTIVANELRPRIEEMRQIDSTTGSSGFTIQFSLLAEVSIKQCDADYAFAEEEDIMSKNRYRGLCPFSDKHMTKENGSYINASEISGYCGQKNFIAAQTPMRNTEGDVWEMIWMEKCAAVVVLCKFVEENDEMCSKFWPLKMSEPKTFGSIKVCLDDKAEQASYNEYHLTVSFTDHPEPLNVVVFHYLQWPRHGRPSIPPYLQLMGEVERSQHNAKGRTLVMCDDGMSRTGVFITTMAEVERVKVQGEVDIFQTVKAARSERPHMVSTPVDYEVCHDVLVSYLESFDTYANFK